MQQMCCDGDTALDHLRCHSWRGGENLAALALTIALVCSLIASSTDPALRFEHKDLLCRGLCL